MQTATVHELEKSIEVKRGKTVYRIDEEVMNAVRIKLYEWRPKDLADQIGVSVSCIYSVRAGRTKWPRGKNLFALLDACGIEMHLYDRRRKRYL